MKVPEGGLGRVLAFGRALRGERELGGVVAIARPKAPRAGLRAKSGEVCRRLGELSQNGTRGIRAEVVRLLG